LDAQLGFAASAHHPLPFEKLIKPHLETLQQCRRSLR
jgi:hypothetical protein